MLFHIGTLHATFASIQKLFFIAGEELRAVTDPGILLGVHTVWRMQTGKFDVSKYLTYISSLEEEQSPWPNLIEDHGRIPPPCPLDPPLGGSESE